MIQIGKILKQVPIFSMLGKESIDFIVERMKFKSFSANQTICQIGDPGDEMFIIINGEVKICIYGDDGKQEQVVATLKSGDYFGEMALLTGETRSASVIATEDSETFVLQQKDFDVILEKYPSISLSMGKIVSKRLGETLKKATQASKTIEHISTSQSGPEGNLKEIALVDLISFCESNSLTGSMKVVNGSQTGSFNFETGKLGTVALGDLKDDKALDEMLTWTDGQFKITVKPLTIGKESTSAKTTDAKNILVVNNSLVVRKIIERAFKGLGYAVNTAKNIAESETIINNQTVDLIIADIKLPDGSGDIFAEQIRQKSKTPFIFLTDSSVRAEFEDKINKIENAELTKTQEVSEIVKLVENLL